MNPPIKGVAKFDIGHLSPRALTYNDVSNRAQRKARPMLSCEANSTAMIGNKEWLGVYGLKANKLSMQCILPGSGFRHANDYDDGIKRDVCSKYAEGLFVQYPRKDGKVYNIVGGKERLQQYCQQLSSAIAIYDKRLQWMTTGSRRYFGVIQEKNITIVIDIHTNDEQRFNLYISALEQLLNDQISKLDKFNIIRSAQQIDGLPCHQDSISWKDNLAEVNNASINDAIEWLKNLDRYTLSTNTCVVEAVEQAFQYRSSNYGVYLFTENGSTDRAREILRSKVQSKRDTGISLHTVAYNTTDQDTITFLRCLAKCTKNGRFHAFSITETDVNEMTGETTFYGGTPPGAGMPEEVMMIWTELEAAKDTLTQLEELQKSTAPPSDTTPRPVTTTNQSTLSTTVKPPSGQYLNSKQWIEQNGMDARSLDFYVFLSSVAFRHCDGVVKITEETTSKGRSPKKSAKKELHSKNALINAKYCENFVHVLWKDGRVRHVQVTGKMFRDYENRMNTMLNALQLRMTWLCQGSRELFGTICEERVYILLDTSASMESRIAMVKDKLYQLMQEQLRHKVMFNIVAFDSAVKPWKDALMNVTEANLREAWDWVKNVETGGSTNTLGALKQALCDPRTEAVYLLSDGRPDHKPKAIYAQACLHPRIPVHTISFNCHEPEANDFLRELAEISGGRFHVYFDSRAPSDSPKGYMSEDLSLLRQEAERGKQSLRLVAKLRAECAALEWSSPSSVQTGGGRVKTAGRSSNSSIHSGRNTSSERGTPRPASTARGSGRNVIDPVKELTLFEEQRLQAMRKTVHQIQRYDMMDNASTTRGSSTGGPKQEDWLLEETQRMFENQKLRRDLAVQAAIDRLEQIDTARSQVTSRNKKLSRTRERENTDIKTWIKTNSIVAKRLTIIDALSSTLVTQTPRFVPSIDKVVLSKVFDDILPISYATSGQKNEIHLVNPSAVDLKLYEQKLSDLIQLYNKKLDRTIWESFPPEEKAKYSNIAPSWETDRATIWESLKRCDWPVGQEEIQIIIDEIELGKKFLQQSIDLRLSTQSQVLDSRKRNENESKRSKTDIAVKDKTVGKVTQDSTRKTRRPLTARNEVNTNRRHTLERFKSSSNPKSAREFTTPSTQASYTDLRPTPEQKSKNKVELSEDEVRLVNLYRTKLRNREAIPRSKSLLQSILTPQSGSKRSSRLDTTLSSEEKSKYSTVRSSSTDPQRKSADNRNSADTRKADFAAERQNAVEESSRKTDKGKENPASVDSYTSSSRSSSVSSQGSVSKSRDSPPKTDSEKTKTDEIDKVKVENQTKKQVDHPPPPKKAETGMYGNSDKPAAQSNSSVSSEDSFY